MKSTFLKFLHTFFLDEKSKQKNQDDSPFESFCLSHILPPLGLQNFQIAPNRRIHALSVSQRKEFLSLKCFL